MSGYAAALRRIEEKIDRLSEQVARHHDELLGSQAAATFLRLSVDQLYRKTSAGQIPVHRKGRFNWYSKAELTAWIMGES